MTCDESTQWKAQSSAQFNHRPQIGSVRKRHDHETTLAGGAGRIVCLQEFDDAGMVELRKDRYLPFGVGFLRFTLSFDVLDGYILMFFGRSIIRSCSNFCTCQPYQPKGTLAERANGIICIQGFLWPPFGLLLGFAVGVGTAAHLPRMIKQSKTYLCNSGSPKIRCVERHDEK